MAYNGSGTFNLYTPGNPVVTGSTISSTWANATLSDLATGLTTAITKDGQTTITAAIPFAQGASFGGAFVLDSSGNLAVTTNKFTVTAASGNTAVAGTLAVTGHTTFEGVTSTGATGTGKLVYDTSPTLVTPNLGTPSALVGTNITGTAAGLTAGAATTATSATSAATLTTPRTINGVSFNGSANITVPSDVYTGTTASNLDFPVGTIIAVRDTASGTMTRNNTVVPYLDSGLVANAGYSNTVSGTALTGTWNLRGLACYVGGGAVIYLAQRTA